MDDRSIEKMIKSREQGYIWLERELKMKLGISTAFIAVFFFVIRCLEQNFRYWLPFLVGALVTNGIWNYFLYKREYGNYLSISRYLNAFEEGDYDFHTEEDYMKSGIHSQITEHLERIGSAFGTLRNRLVEEKENTKALITDISHQLKTPIAALGLSFELVKDEDITAAEKMEFLERAEQEVGKLNYLLGTLLNLSRLEADMIRLEPKEASLKETLVRAVNGIFIKANEKKIEIEMEGFKDVSLQHDPRWTAEAFANVMDNAVKYSPEKSRIQIRVEREVSYVLIEIEDEGIGIPKEEYSNIFKRFYRGKSPEVEAMEGAGVGLYLVREILEAQGGSVRALPSHRGGTVFQMMLPKKKYSLE